MANVVSVVRRATCSLIAKNSCVGWVPLNCNSVFRYSHYLPSCRAMTLSQGMHIVVRAECASADEPGCCEPLAQTLVFRRVGLVPAYSNAALQTFCVRPDIQAHIIRNSEHTQFRIAGSRIICPSKSRNLPRSASSPGSLPAHETQCVEGATWRQRGRLYVSVRFFKTRELRRELLRSNESHGRAYASL